MKLSECFVSGVASACLLCFFCSCSSGTRIKELEDAEIRHSKEISDLRAVAAEHTVGIEQIRSDLRRLNGNVEEIDFHARGKTAEIQKTLALFSSRVPPPSCVPEDLISDDDAFVASNNSPSAVVFKDGLQKIRSGNFEGSIESFNSFLEKSPSTVVSDNALFWVGVARSCLGQSDRAIVSFSDVFSKFPGEDRAPWSLYYLAEVFAKMGQKEEAKVAYQKVVDEFGSSSAGKKAEAKLRSEYGAKLKSQKSSRKK